MFRRLKLLLALLCTMFVMCVGAAGAARAAAEFTVTTTPDTSEFSFKISAAGEFTIDWGDGNVETITKSDTTNTTYSHTYSTAGAYEIGIAGQATAYNSSTTTAAISFYTNLPNAKKVAGISGSLGAIFGTLADGTQPSFYRTFYKCTNLAGSIPEGLFSGIEGAPAYYMFMDTFYGCSNLSGSIPEGLFSGIQGAPAIGMFMDTFYGCSNLSGSIPEGLFSGIQGAPAEYMFMDTFYGCSNLSGSIPEGLFSGIQGAPAEYMFFNTFWGCWNISGSIPEGLFSGIQGAPAESMFYGTFNGCSNLSGSIPERLFSGIQGAPAEYMFYLTFYGCSGLTGYVDGGMFSGITGTASNAYTNTFYGTSKMDTVCPADTYAVDKPDSSWTVAVCNACPDGTFSPAGSDGAAACVAPEAEFTVTTTSDTSEFSFYISAAGEFTVDWGDGNVETITKSDTNYTTYSHTYSTAGAYEIGIAGQATAYNSSTTTAAISFYTNLPNAKKVAGISGSLGAIFGTLADGTQPRFYQTFYGCTNLTGSIPEELFSGIQGTPAKYMFYYTFYNCSGLTGSIPAKLFSGISGAPADSMFDGTFSDCGNLTGSIPEGLFSGIQGAPADSMFYRTFYYCRNLTGSIPEGLFSGISGAPAEYMFDGTFRGCSNLTGYVDGDMFSKITGTASNAYTNTFYGTSKMDTVCPADTYAVDKPDSSWTVAVCNACPDGTFSPAGSDGAAACKVPFTPEFTVTTTPDTSSFSFKISAAGEFTIDWGDGTVETITKSDTNYTTYSHTYSTAGAYEIGIAGQATGYNTKIDWGSSSQLRVAAISFEKNTNVAGISGSLGAIFGTLADGTQPSFYQTFYECTNLTGSIPENLFAGITGAPAHFMFAATFRGCTGLTGSIPEGLFSGISGAPAWDMFFATFSGCTGLTGSIPEGLFGGIQGAPALHMFNSTFMGCSGLTGSIPEGLFSGISGAPAGYMFQYTFYGCSGLTGSIPAGLFGGISGAPASDMFKGTFRDCSGLTGSIPEGLFSGISGAPAEYMFLSTFAGCTGLTGSIPEGLFSGISGAPIDYMFSDTFRGCSGLTGSIPAGLFGGISGAPASDMFSDTFQGCTGLTGSIPAGLFGGISGAPAYRMFYSTFEGCSGLTGSIPEGLFSGISGTPARYMFATTFYNCRNLSGSIPENLFSGIQGAAAYYMFTGTFYGCSNLTGYVDGDMFSKITGTASKAYTGTFTGASKMDTACPADTYAVDKPDSSWTVAVCLPCTDESTNPECTTVKTGIVYDLPHGRGTQSCYFNDVTGQYDKDCVHEGIIECDPGYWSENSTDTGCVAVGYNYYSPTDDTQRYECPAGGETRTETADAPTACFKTKSTYTGLYGSGRRECFYTSGQGDDAVYATNCEAPVLDECLGGYYYNKDENPMDCVKVGYGYYSEPGSAVRATCPDNGLTELETTHTADMCYKTNLTCTVNNGTGTNICNYNPETGEYNGDCTTCAVTTCQAGYYQVLQMCQICPKGNVCENKTLQSCASLTDDKYTMSDEGVSDVNKCYTDCALAEHATKMTGRDYYDGTNTCEIVQCGAGYWLNNGKCEICPAGSICHPDVENGAPQLCSTVTDGTHTLSDQGASQVQQCYKKCVGDTIEYGTAIAYQDTLFWPNECSFYCKSETEHIGAIVDGVCVENDCDSDYERISGRCEPCNRENALTYKIAGNCQVETCKDGYHPQGDKCANDVISCYATNAVRAEQEWDAVRGVYTVCLIKECEDGYHIESNACEPDVQSCNIANGIGEHEWNHRTESWGECVAVSCNPGYTSDPSEMDMREGVKPCGRCRNAFGENGDLAVSLYSEGCEISSCLYQGELYDLQGNECVAICEIDGYNDETGSRKWNPATKKCEFNCAPGYIAW